MEKKKLLIEDNRSFLERLVVALAPQDELVAYKAREIVKAQAVLNEKNEVSTTVPERSARFLGFI